MITELFGKDERIQQIRHAAKCLWPRIGRRIGHLDLCQQLDRLGYNGCIVSLAAEEIIEAWKNLGWTEVSPDGRFYRLTPKGEEKLAEWEDVDRAWMSGERGGLPLAKRLIAGEPARNLRKIKSVIGSSTVVGVHDPYTTAGSLETLLKLADIGTNLSQSLRMLRPPMTKATERTTLLSLLKDVNTERKSTWEVRTYVGTTKPHRRFLVLDDHGIVTCGMSLNYIDKDEVLDREPSGSENANHDRKFFEEKWRIGTPI